MKGQHEKKGNEESGIVGVVIPAVYKQLKKIGIARVKAGRGIVLVGIKASGACRQAQAADEIGVMEKKDEQNGRNKGEDEHQSVLPGCFAVGQHENKVKKTQSNGQVKPVRNIEQELQQQEDIKEDQIRAAALLEVAEKVKKAEGNGKVEHHVEVGNIENAEGHEDVQGGGDERCLLAPSEFSEEQIGTISSKNVAKEGEDVVDQIDVVQAEQVKRQQEQGLTDHVGAHGKAVGIGKDNRQVVDPAEVEGGYLIHVRIEDSYRQVDISIQGIRQGGEKL